jgi:hypothetical protein
VSVFEPPNQREALESLARAHVGPHSYEDLTPEKKWAIGFQLADAFVYALLDLADAIRDLAPAPPSDDAEN